MGYATHGPNSAKRYAPSAKPSATAWVAGSVVAMRSHLAAARAAAPAALRNAVSSGPLDPLSPLDQLRLLGLEP